MLGLSPFPHTDALAAAPAGARNTLVLVFQMWKASAGHTVPLAQEDSGADDWETDPDFVVGLAGWVSGVFWVFASF